jgi:hypothetical protein
MLNMVIRIQNSDPAAMIIIEIEVPLPVFHKGPVALQGIQERGIISIIYLILVEIIRLCASTEKPDPAIRVLFHKNYKVAIKSIGGVIICKTGTVIPYKSPFRCKPEEFLMVLADSANGIGWQTIGSGVMPDKWVLCL